MTCNPCEMGFQGNQTIVPTISRSGTNAYLYITNQGRNIVLIRRILLCVSSSGGSSVFYLRYPDQMTWTYPSTYLEPGIGALYYTLANVASNAIVQAQAEYIEIEGRARSCAG